MQEGLQSDSGASQIIIVNNAGNAGADQGSNMFARHAVDGSVRAAWTRQNTGVGNRINGSSRGTCGGNIDPKKHGITGSSRAKPGGLMPPGQKRPLTPECEAEQEARRLHEAADAKEKLEQALSEYAWLFQGTRAAEAYYKTEAAPTASAFGMPDPDFGERMRYLEDKVMKLEGRLAVLGDQHLALSSALPHLASAVAAQNERLDKLSSSVPVLYEPNSVNKA